jgi:hypothetical protein
MKERHFKIYTGSEGYITFKLAEFKLMFPEVTEEELKIKEEQIRKEIEELKNILKNNC